MRSLLALSFLVAIPPDAGADPAYPRLANIYLHGFADTANIPALARWDLLVLDTVWNETELAQLRQRNPDIRIFFYVCSYCVDWPGDAADGWEQGNTTYAAANDLWWYDRDGQPASDWPGSRMANITALAPAGPQGAWREYMAARIASLVASRPSLDGVMLDNFWAGLSWNQSQLQLDSDCNPTHDAAGCDSTADAPAALDSLWNQALQRLASDVRARFDALEAGRARPLALVGNGASDYFESLNGSIHEAFPSGWSDVDPGNPYRYNWNREMLDPRAGYLVAPFSSRPYTASIMNAVWAGTQMQPERSVEFERHKRFTFVSTLLGDGFYSLDAGQESGNGALWWEPEYDHAGRGTGYLGQPLGPVQRVGVASGPELVANGDFTNATAGWEWYGFGATGSLGSDGGAGRVTVQSVTPGGEFKVWQVGLALDAGSSYVLALRARADRSTVLSLHLDGPGCPSGTCLGSRTFELDTAWTSAEVLFVAPGTTDAGLNLFVRSPGSVWIDDVSLREGDVSVYRRDFERGTVLLNYTAAPQSIPLGASYTRLQVPGSPVFDGASVSVESVPPWDGRILLRHGAGPVQRGELQQNEPNPFNPSTRIRFELLAPEHVRLAVLDARGRLVRVLVDAALPAGTDHAVEWDGTDRAGTPVRSGNYFYRLETPSFVATRKMTLLR